MKVVVVLGVCAHRRTQPYTQEHNPRDFGWDLLRDEI